MFGEMNNEQHVMPLLGPNVREIDRRYIIMSKGTKLVSLFSISLYVVQVRILLDCNITINQKLILCADLLTIHSIFVIYL